MNDFAQPKIGDNVTLNRTRLGQYVHLADDAILEEVEMGDYSYTAGHNQIFYATLGKFVSIASYARINPGNHPTYQRIAQHHFTYRASEYGLGKTTRRSSTGGASTTSPSATMCGSAITPA